MEVRYCPRLVRRPARFVMDLLVLSRPAASLCAGTQILIGAHLTSHAGRSAVNGASVLREGIAILLVVAAVNVVNDIVDVRADAISRPGRPLPAGRVSTLAAWRLAGVHGLLAMVLSVGVPTGLEVTLILLLLGLCYSCLLKGTVLVGNLVVALLAATPIVYGGWLGGAQAVPVLVAAVMIFLFMFAFEVLKTIRDVVADRAADYRTVATQWGIRSTSAIFRASLAAYAVVAATPMLLAGVSSAYAVLMWPGAVVPSLVVSWLLPVRNSATAVRLVLRVMAISWVPGLAALALAFRH
jgi:4-hydroxybenzoate polyprenyltransferase